MCDEKIIVNFIVIDLVGIGSSVKDYLFYGNLLIILNRGIMLVMNSELGLCL